MVNQKGQAFSILMFQLLVALEKIFLMTDIGMVATCPWLPYRPTLPKLGEEWFIVAFNVIISICFWPLAIENRVGHTETDTPKGELQLIA